MNYPMIDIAFREVGWGFVFMWSAFIFLCCFRYVVCRMGEPFWRDMAGAQLAVGVAVLMIGLMIIGGFEWGLLWHINRNVDVAEWRDNYMLIFVAAVVVTVGGVCTVRVLSREAWGHWVWATATFLAVAVPIAVHWL